MKKIKLISDSTCDLSKELIEKHDIEIIPLYVNFSDASYEDGTEITTDAMYRKVSETGEVPKTAAASPGTFEAVFKKHIDQGNAVLYMGIGSGFSATYQNANIAKNMIGSEDIHLVDSMNLSSASGLLLLKAAKFIEEGDAVDTVASEVEALRSKVRTQFIIDTFEYLHKGGRLKAISAMVGTMMRVKPIIRVVEGEMAIGKKPRGKLQNGIRIMLRDVFKDAENIDEDFLMITHSQSHENADFIRDELAGKLNVNNIHETEAGCVISSHCGRRTIGVLYITK